MDLSKRLAHLDALLRAPRGAAGGAGCTPDAGDAEAAVARAVAALGLAPREGTAGTAWARDEATAAPCPPPAAAALAALAGVLAPRPGATPVAPAGGDGLLLLDTETTGLAGGTGTVPFLVGAAWWEGATLRTRQWFLASPGREEPLLADLAGHAARFAVVVTYNGQSFDLPLLRTRALLARRPDPLAGLAGWDLLHAARRLWGRRLADCRQPTVEASVCGLARGTDDVPGALIPPIYFRYLRTGQPDDLSRVLAHNRRDLHGMAAILAAAAARAAALDDPPAGALPDVLPWADAWCAARLCERQGRLALAAAWLAGALAGGVAAAEAPEPLFADAVRILKRRRDWNELAAALAGALDAAGDRPWIHREAAILYEHRLRDLPRAWAHAQRLGDAARLARLARKLGPGPA